MTQKDPEIVSAVAMQAAPCKDHRELMRAMQGWEEQKCIQCLRAMLLAVCHHERRCCESEAMDVALELREKTPGLDYGAVLTAKRIAARGEVN